MAAATVMAKRGHLNAAINHATEEDRGSPPPPHSQASEDLGARAANTRTSPIEFLTAPFGSGNLKRSLTRRSTFLLSPTAASAFGGTQKQLETEDETETALKHLEIDQACLDLRVRRLSGRAYEDARFVLTNDAIALGSADCSDDNFDDVILLHQVDKVEDVACFSEKGWGSCIKTSGGVLAICTAAGGLNSGRKYCFQVDAETDEERTAYTCMVQTLQGLVKKAKIAMIRQNASLWLRSRNATRAMFDSLFFQVVIAFLLTINFVVNAFEAEMNGKLVHADGSQTELAIMLEYVDMFFTFAFTVELLLNLHAHWFVEFISDGWAVFDFIIVSISLFSRFSGLNLPVSIFRLLRAFRVLRIFGRLKAIRSIVNALSASLFPVLNAFFIMGIVLCLYAIIGVTFYDSRAPDDFGNLSRAIISMFRIAAGETWVSGIPVVGDSGEVDWGTGAFVLSFVLVVNWTLLQVTVAVLLDNFVAETARERGTEKDLELEAMRSKDQMGNVLDPLLKVLANEYIDKGDLDNFLTVLFHNLDADSSGALNREETILGFRKVHPAIPVHFSAPDFDVLTHRGAFLNPDGNMDLESFKMAMTEQVHGYIRRKLQRSTSETESQEQFSLYASLKLLTEQVDELQKAFQAKACYPLCCGRHVQTGSPPESDSKPRPSSDGCSHRRGRAEPYGPNDGATDGLQASVERLADEMHRMRGDMERVLKHLGIAGRPDSSTQAPSETSPHLHEHEASSPASPPPPARYSPLPVIIGSSPAVTRISGEIQTAKAPPCGTSTSNPRLAEQPSAQAAAGSRQSKPEAERTPTATCQGSESASRSPALGCVHESAGEGPRAVASGVEHAQGAGVAAPSSTAGEAASNASWTIDVMPGAPGRLRPGNPFEAAAVSEEEGQGPMSEELIREQERLQDLRRRSEASAGLRAIGAKAKASSSLSAGAPLSFRSILKTHLPFREEWEKRLSSGQNINATASGGGTRQGIRIDGAEFSSRRHSLPTHATASVSRNDSQPKSRLALELEQKASAAIAGGHDAGEHGPGVDADAVDHCASRPISGISAASDADDLTLWT